jgi:cytosine permease
MEDRMKTLLEDFGASPVPDSQQKGWFGIGIVYWGVAVCLPAFLVSGLIAGPATLGSAIAAFTIGAAVLAVIAVLSGVIGAHTKLSTGLSSTYTFGSKGAYVFQLMLFFASWGWFGVQLGFMASGLGNGGLAFAIGGALPGWVLKIVGGALMTLTAMMGFKALEKLSLLAIPLLLVTLGATTISIYGGETTLAEVATQSAAGAMPFGVAVSFVISSFVLGALIAPDVTRYARSKSDAGGGMAFGMMIGFPVVMTLAAVMVKGAGGEPDFSRVMLANNAGIWVLIAIVTIILAAWTTNDNNLYSGALSLNAMFPSLKKWQITLASGVVGTVLALVGINTSGGFQAFLGIIAIVIPPAAAVMLVDFYFYRGEGNRAYAPERSADVSAVRALPLACWVVASAAGFVIQYTPVRLTSITAVDTILIAAVLYFVAAAIGRKQIAARAAASPAE